MAASLDFPGLKQCRDCTLALNRLRVVPGFGAVPSKVMFLAQSPGRVEDARGIPLVGPSGQLLSEACGEVGWDLNTLFRDNVNRCHPLGDRKAKPTEVAACRKWLDMTIEAVDPDVIVALGDQAMHAMLPKEREIAITKIHGLVYRREVCGRDRFIVPVFHPAFVGRNKSVLYPQLLKDLRIAKSLLNGQNSSPVPYSDRLGSWEEFMEIVKRGKSLGEFAIDFETAAFYKEIVGIGVAVGPGRENALYWPAENHDELLWRWQELKPYLEDPSIIKIIQNANYEIMTALPYNTRIRNVRDTMIEAWLLGDRPSLGLKSMALRYLGMEMIQIEDLIGSGKKQRSMRDVQNEDENLVGRYAAADPDATWRLHKIHQPLLKERGVTSLYEDVELPIIDVIVGMQRVGMKVDPTKFAPINSALDISIGKLRAEIAEMAGRDFNPRSPDESAKVLYYEKKIVPVPRRFDGKFPKTDKVTLALYSHDPLIRAILSYRAQTKLKSTYTGETGLPKYIQADGRIHSQIRQTGTETGRVSSNHPNMQNIPARGRDDVDMPVSPALVRSAFVAEEGYFLAAPDLSQIELRILGHLSQDRAMISVLDDPAGDIHTATMRVLFGDRAVEEADDRRRTDMRFVAKTVNFGIAYGLTAEGLILRTPSLGLTRPQAQGYIDRIFGGYPGIPEWQQKVIRDCRKRGYVTTLLGRRRYIPDINSSDRQKKAAAERMAINTPVQGGAADYFKVCLLIMAREIERRGLRSKMIMQVHDEIVVEVPFEELDEIATDVVPLFNTAIPLDVAVRSDMEYGFDWGNLIKY